MQEYGFHLTRILWCNNRILDSVLIRENTGQWKLVYPHFKPTKSPLCFIVLLIILPEYNLSSRKWTKNIFTFDLLVKGTVFYQTSKERKELIIFTKIVYFYPIFDHQRGYWSSSKEAI